VDAIIRRFSLLPILCILCKEVQVVYQNPVVLTATTSGPDHLGNLQERGELQVEVQSEQMWVAEPWLLLLLLLCSCVIMYADMLQPWGLQQWLVCLMLQLAHVCHCSDASDAV
jgi:hypothetical protein